MDEILVGLTSWGLFGAFIYYLYSQMKHKNDASRFSQNGVSVDYDQKTISIKGNEFNVSQVRRVWMEGKYIHFELEDMNTPLKKVRFSHEKIAREFISRIEMALTKAKNA